MHAQSNDKKHLKFVRTECLVRHGNNCGIPTQKNIKRTEKCCHLAHKRYKPKKINCVFLIKLIEYGVKLKWHFILVFFVLRISFIAQAKRCAEIATMKGQAFC